MASIVDIANNALNILGASTISSLTEDTKNARICNQRFENVRNRICLTLDYLQNTLPTTMLQYCHLLKV